MALNKSSIVIGFGLVLVLSPCVSPAKNSEIAPQKPEVTGQGPAVLWRDPVHIWTRDLYYGAGGKTNQPRGSFTFLKEDLDGTSPKFIARDQDGARWQGKLGLEARPETVASRLVWAVGYFTGEDYFVPKVHVVGMPSRLKRVHAFPNGSLYNVRLKRYAEGEEKAEIWSWRANPFTGTRELNGLRVLMALINNWDLKDDNNAIFETDDQSTAGRPERIFMVSDLGATFGSTGVSRTMKRSKDNLESFRRSQFIKNIEDDSVDFSTPHRPTLFELVKPREFAQRVHMESIGKRIPRSDVRWIGKLLAELSPNQIRDAFWAAGYSQDEVEAFAKVLEDRIASINDI